MASAPPPAFVAHCMELLAPLGHVRTKRMFGGWGLYADDLFVALIAFDRLYLKADDGGKAALAAAGSQPFVYDAAGKQVSLGYWTAPDDAMDSAALMQPWARLALRAAVAARAGTPSQRQRAVKPPGKATAPRKRATTTGAASAPAKNPAAKATKTAPG